MGNIGKERRRVEVLPEHTPEPDSTPAPRPGQHPAPEPDHEPQPG